MADQAIVHLGENSVEQVAYKLMVHIFDCERKAIRRTTNKEIPLATRDEILDTYTECLYAVKAQREPPQVL